MGRVQFQSHRKPARKKAVPHIGKTLRENKSVREIVLERKLMSEADLEHVLNPEMMTEVHFEQRKAM